MADLSLGRLRIANPDDASHDISLRPQPSPEAVPAVSPLTSMDQRQDYSGAVLHRENSDLSRSIESFYPETTPIGSPPDGPSASRHTPKRTDWTPQRQSMGYTYQEQQQAQFPQYPTMMPQNLHDPRSNTSRPGSTYYTQMPVRVESSSGNGISRQGSHRANRLENPGSTPQRSVSKRSPGPPQIGALPCEDGLDDRGYRQPQYLPANGPLPFRRASRNVAPSRTGTTSNNNHTPPLSGTPMSTNTPMSSSPYALEGGPLSSAEDWQERGAAVGVQRDYDTNGRPVLKAIKKGVKDFNFGQTLGEGSYSTVLMAQDRQTSKDYAIKVLDKRHIIKEKKVKYVNIEKETLNRLTDHPGIVRLYYTFQDERSLYFVLDLCSGGELLSVLKRMTTFDEECTRFYGAQILDSIEYMHKKGVIHRDLKPENVLLDDNKYIKITDFGTAKMLNSYKDADGITRYQADSSPIEDRASSFVGTAEYVSPELLTDKNACKASDLWAFGCIVYQLLAGRPPFKAGNEYLTFQKIVALEYEFPRGFPEIAKDLVERLLVLDPHQRLTLENIKNHPFFDGIKWGRGLWQQKAPRLKAYVPPPAPLIKLNGSSPPDSYPPDVPSSHGTHPTILPPNNVPKPLKPRVITELPPPSQLDIEWSPVLTRNNERILKLGNLSVLNSQNPHSPGQESGGKFSRFFGGSTNKKRQRLVMVTSSARIIIAAAGGEEKKSKSEISLISPGTEVVSSTSAKGITNWTVNTRDKHFAFEDVKINPSEPHATALSTQEWLDAIERAKDMANMQASQNNFSSDDISNSAFSSHSTLDQQPDFGSSPPAGHSHSGRGVLQKHSASADSDSLKGRKRFSKRQSKSGLTAVF